MYNYGLENDLLSSPPPHPQFDAGPPLLGHFSQVMAAVCVPLSKKDGGYEAIPPGFLPRRPAPKCASEVCF